MIKVRPLLFGQHRCHSIYLAFGGDKKKLVDELLGRKSGCTKGMGGSASIHSKDINMYGHDGLMGSNGPIGVGACFATGKPTIIFLGDAAAEEDYVLGSLGWASTKNIPLLTVPPIAVISSNRWNRDFCPSESLSLQGHPTMQSMES